METPQLHRYDRMPPLIRRIKRAVTPKFAKASKPTPDEIEEATRGRSFWHLASLLFREQLPRREH